MRFVLLIIKKGSSFGFLLKSLVIFLISLVIEIEFEQWHIQYGYQKPTEESILQQIHLFVLKLIFFYEIKKNVLEIFFGKTVFER